MHTETLPQFLQVGDVEPELSRAVPRMVHCDAGFQVFFLRRVEVEITIDAREYNLRQQVVVRDFAEGFSKSLSLADELLLMDIYPAREEPIPGVTSDMLFKDITSAVKIRCTKSDVLQKLEDLDIEVLATVGAGDIDTLVKPIKEMINRRMQ